MRLKPIAAERASTAATMIQKSCRKGGTPPKQTHAEVRAKGKAKTVCSN